jgi:hypothetical protein
VVVKIAQLLGGYGPGEEIVGEGKEFSWGLSVVEQALNEIFVSWEKKQRDYKGNSRVWVTAVTTEAAPSGTPDEDEPPF